MTETAFRGTAEAVGFVIDVGLLGEPEARRRVLRRWAAGARLHELPEGRWLMVLAEPVVVRSERAPGLVVHGGDGGLAAGGAQPGPVGTLSCLEAGIARCYSTTDLVTLEPASWLTLGARETVDLTPRDRSEPPVSVAAIEKPKPPDVRALARVKPRSKEGERQVQALADEARAVAKRRPLSRGRLARLVLRTPAANVVGRAHQRYLGRLERSFETRDYETALRDAIGLSGSSQGYLSLRLPRPRQGKLSPSPSKGTGGRPVPYGPSVHDHLRALYTRAAEQLEREGRIEEAAFVYADLIGSAPDACVLLERHERYELAASLGEGRELPPDQVVRLWWLAGNRRRATDVARTRGAWAQAIRRLEETDGALANALRAEWVLAARDAGDHALAVEVAWPRPPLRELVVDDLGALRARGGRTAARALARLVSWRPEPELLVAAAALTDGRDAEWAPERAAFADELVVTPCRDPAVDRELTSRALRALVRDCHTPSGLGTRALSEARRKLAERADPLLRADLPSLPAGDPERLVPLLLAAPESGHVRLDDAVWIDHGLLVALGAAGVRLVDARGHERARWDVPCDRFCVADHGDRVLLLASGDALTDVHVLDLVTRKVRRWAVLAQTWPLESCDGGIVPAVDQEGIVGFDLTTDPPREMWRHLTSAMSPVGAARSADGLAALVVVPLQGRSAETSLELWQWELPSRRLTGRTMLDVETHEGAHVLACGDLVWIAPDEAGEPREFRERGSSRRSRPAPEGAVIVATGDVHGVIEPASGRLAIRERDQSVAVVEFAGAQGIWLRSHDGRVAARSADGRVVVVDCATRELVANVTVRP